MKRHFFLLALFCTAVFAQAKQPNVAVFYNQFQNTNGKPYIETYFSLDPYSVVFTKNENNIWQGGIEILLTIEQNNEIIGYDKIQLLSPETSDTNQSLNPTLQFSRISLAEGEYTLKIEVADREDRENPIRLEQSIEIEANNEDLTTSNVLLLDSYKKAETETISSKWGFDMVPIVPVGTYLIDENSKSLPFYLEIYNADKRLGENEPYLVKYFLKDNLTGQLLPEYAGFQKVTSAAVNPILRAFNITNLGSGYYSLEVEVFDKTNQMAYSNNVSFYRKNVDADLEQYGFNNASYENTFIDKIQNKDSLIYYVECLYPISTRSERRIAANITSAENEELMRRFLLVFWTNRDPMDYEEAWANYMKKVEYTQEKFGSSSYEGFKTDMGRVYLQYGPPSMREKGPREYSSYPYEIWQYDELTSASSTRQVNQSFVFVDQTLSGRSYVLIHSTASGELQDYKWAYQVNRQTNRGRDVDSHSGTKSRDEFGERINNNFIIGGQSYWQGDK